MSSESRSRRRSRSLIESEEEEEDTEFPTQSKRIRTNGYQSEAESEASAHNAPTATQKGKLKSRRQDVEDNEEGEDGGDLNTFQPGAIVRVKLHNFVTYENAEFFPGPSLNMVIGPNGTGKSSLVCAICLGLGWGPQVLGRPAEVGTFVKNGTSFAEIEIELQRRNRDLNNPVIRLRITKDGNGRDWWIGGKRSSHKAVQALTKSLSIQIDNLCQFLPQDKVAAFAGLSPVELLQRTQEAAAPQQMLEWHEELKNLRKDQKELAAQHETDQAQLDNHETRQQNLRAEVERLQERRAVQKRIQFLEYTMPLVDYNTAVARHNQCKAEKKEAQERQKALERRIAPTIKSINAKKAYRDQVDFVVRERIAVVRSSEREADDLAAKISKLQDEMKNNEESIDVERNIRSEQNKGITAIRNTIRTLEARLRIVPEPFDPSEWNQRVRVKEQELRGHREKGGEIKARMDELHASGIAARVRRDDAKQDLRSLESQEGKLMQTLDHWSKDTATAWKWIQEHMSEFEEEVYAPPLISCSVTDPNLTSAIESMVSRNDALAITVQTLADMNKLSDRVYRDLGLTDITLRSVKETVSTARPLTPDHLSAYGMDGWAIDFLDGPNPVLAMLCNSRHLDKCAVTRRDINETQYEKIVQEGRIKSWVTSTHSFTVSSRMEYGAAAKSTNTRKLQPAKMWIDQPVDTSAQVEINARINAAEAELIGLKSENEELKRQGAAIKADYNAANEAIATLKKKKEELQKANTEHNALPMKIEREEEALERKRAAASEAQANEAQARDKLDATVVRKMKATLQYKDQVSKIRSLHADLLEARIRLLEAESDVSGLERLNEDIVRQQKEEEERVKAFEAESRRMKQDATIKRDRCLEIFALEEVDNDMKVELRSYAEQTTMENLEHEIDAEKSKLDYIHLNNPNAIRDFESRQADIDRLREKINSTIERLRTITHDITKIRNLWEPELDKLIGEISDAFSFNFEQIGCAGEVSVHKDDDFDLWAIQIKVKFRQNETLQLLDQHRQSGGERSVSTIFYLMSLQALAQAPFRVVDEINQGMDPRNERMVHERMVDIACKEHTSQYFLITPKLLTGLRYHPRMKVLCIASGEHMPENYKRLDISKIIGIRRAIIAAG